jgi:hypothetical protein
MIIKYVLMVWLIDMQAYGMLPVKGNPYPTFEACRVVRSIIIRRRITHLGEGLGSYHFTNPKCEKKEYPK